MKKLLYIFFLSISISSFAQFTNNIPNPDFEGDYKNYAPENWSTLSIYNSNAGWLRPKVEITADCQEGQSALKLTAMKLSEAGAKFLKTDILPGFVSLGYLNTYELANTYIDIFSVTDFRVLAPFFYNGISLQGIPAKIEGYYKYKSSVPPTLFAFTKKGREVVNYGKISTLTQSNAYQKFELVFNTGLSMQPDEFYIVAMTGREEGDELFLDNLSIVYHKDLALGSILPSEGMLNPVFSSACQNYKISLPHSTEKISFTAAAKDQESVNVNISGPDSLLTGSNIFTITTFYKGEGETDTNLVYSIDVIRNAEDYVQSNCADLKTLQIGKQELMPEFNKETLFYRLSVENNVRDLQILAELENENAVLVQNPRNILLKEGENTIKLTIIAENGITQKTYQIITQRASLGISPFSVMPTEEMVIYPNPTKKEVHLKFSENRPVTSVQIFSATGKHIKTRPIESENFSIEELPNGFYILKFFSREKPVVTKQIIKQ